tara:strand:+ start:5295 stop:5783 length:489 start_codon:yes stop_codon:yes gene_type:complete
MRLFRKELKSRGGRSYVPMLRERRRAKANPRARRLVRSPMIDVEVMMLPGYVFVQAVDDHAMSVVQNTPGYATVLRGASEHPLRLPPLLMRILERKAGEVFDPSIGVPVFTAGEIVTLMDGPLRSYSGAVEAVNDDNLTILVEIFGRFAPVSVSSRSVVRQK